MIDQLDERRAQVYIESLIVEVTGDNAADFGFQWQGLIGEQGQQQRVVGGTNFGTTGNLLAITQPDRERHGTGGTAATACRQRSPARRGPQHRPGPQLLRHLRPGGDRAAACRARPTPTSLSTPNLVTLDNEEAKIIVGSNVPFVTGQFTQTGGAPTNPFQTIERKDVGITLRIRPQIGENGTIRMTIFQESSSLSRRSRPAPSNAGPIDQQALDRIERRRRRRPDPRPRRPDRGPLHRQQVEGAAARRHPVPRRAVPQREPDARRGPT